MFIRKAERKKAKLRLGIVGASGSGKTRSALEIAFGMVGKNGKIGMIDTESGRGELYAGCTSLYDNELHLNYDIIRLDAPYSPQRYIEAIKAFEAEEYDVVIIDSMSHAWVGEGGVLEIVDNAGGQFQNGWKKATPLHNAFIEAIISSKMHLICTFRAKTEYAVQLNDKGKHAPIKIGMAPVQREGFDYEFTVFMAMDHKHIAHITKDNSEIYKDQDVTPSPEMGIKFMEWLNSGIDPRDQFMKTTLPQMIEVLHHCTNMVALQEKYSSYYRQVSNEYPEALESLRQAKDESKASLEDHNMGAVMQPAPVMRSIIQ